jgi:hypothetical protein
MPLPETRQLVHLRALQDIARQRFPFPNEDYPHLKTFLNDPERTMAVPVGGEALYPDIVVLQWPEKVVEMLAEVETADTVTEEQARQRWLPFSRAGRLYLFVPVGLAQEAKRLCRRLGVEFVGLRTWRYIVGYGSIEITDIETAAGTLEALLPPFLMRRLRDRRSPG